jgi:hypothetical protein
MRGLVAGYVANKQQTPQQILKNGVKGLSE